MSAIVKTAHKMTVPDFFSRKGSSEPLVMLTAYSYPMAKVMAPYVDAILVGDSLGMVLYGHQSTIPVTLDMMVMHSQAVRRGAPDSLIITDLPFGTYQASREQAYISATKALKEGGANAVKIEGGQEMADTINFLVSRGVPVMGHIGIMPQSISRDGMYKVQGKDDKTSGKLMDDAFSIQNAGAFAIVLEGVYSHVADKIVNETVCPIIGIGASASCDGQILVTDDLLGMYSDFCPKFVKRYASIQTVMQKSFEDFSNEVRSRKFPTASQLFKINQ